MRKSFILWWAIPLAVAFLTAVMVSSAPRASSRSVKPDASAEQLGIMLQQITEQYRAADADAAPHRQIIAEQEAALAPIQSRMDQLAEGASGIDHTLCTLYGVRYVRATTGDTGTFEEVAPEECDPLE